MKHQEYYIETNSQTFSNNSPVSLSKVLKLYQIIKMGGSESKQEPQVNLDQFLQSQQYQAQHQQIYGAQNQQLHIHNVEDDGIFDQDLYYKVIEQKQPKAVDQSKAEAVKNELFVNKTTFKLEMVVQPSNKYSNIYILSFRYTAFIPGNLSLYLLASDNGQSIVSQAPYKQQNVYPVQVAENVEFKEQGFYIDINQIRPQQLHAYDSTNSSYPLIVKISNQDDSFSQTYYCIMEFNKTSRIINVQNLLTRVKKNGQTFDIKDVFGINDSVVSQKEDSKKEPCRVCLTNIVDTMIIPCRHVILCLECCESMQRSCEKCPLCRQPIEKYVILKKSDNQQFFQQESQQQPQQVPNQQDTVVQGQPILNNPQPQANKNQFFQGSGVQIG
ncbi:hypothetical protein pb186bvf_004304 [Paramecium bursaria]